MAKPERGARTELRGTAAQEEPAQCQSGRRAGPALPALLLLPLGRARWLPTALTRPPSGTGPAPGSGVLPIAWWAKAMAVSQLPHPPLHSPHLPRPLSSQHLVTASSHMTALPTLPAAHLQADVGHKGSATLAPLPNMAPAVFHLSQEPAAAPLPKGSSSGEGCSKREPATTAATRTAVSGAHN